MRKFFRSLLVLSVVALASCGGSNNTTTPVLGPDGQPTGQVVQQPSQPGFGTFFGAALLGNMVGNMFSGGRSSVAPPAYHSSPPTTIVNRTVVNKTIINHAPVPAPVPAAKVTRPPVVQTPSVVRPPTVTTSPSYRPPSVTSSRSSSGFSSSRGGRR